MFYFKNQGSVPLNSFLSLYLYSLPSDFSRLCLHLPLIIIILSFHNIQFLHFLSLYNISDWPLLYQRFPLWYYPLVSPYVNIGSWPSLF